MARAGALGLEMDETRGHGKESREHTTREDGKEKGLGREKRRRREEEHESK